jgi:hypothetical protein
MKIIMAFAMCVCAWAQSGLIRPQLGKMLDANGAVRTVYGIAASVTLGDAETTGVLSLACSNTVCLAKTETAIVSAGESVAAPGGPALFAFDGDAALVWFPQSRQLARWQGGVLTCSGVDTSVDAARTSACATSRDIDGEVLSIGVSAGAVRFAVRRRSGVWIVNQDGTVLDSLPRSTVAVMLIPGGVVYATESEIVIRNVQFPLAGVTAFSQMSGSYLAVRAGGVNYSLRIDEGREALFQLPGMPQ